MYIKTWSELIDAFLLRKVSFLVSFFVVFLCTYGFLSYIDFLPEPVPTAPVSSSTSEESQNTTSVSSSTEPEGNVAGTSTVSAEVQSEPLFPDTIIIDGLERNISVLNPRSRQISDLDAALLYGVVRHPDSATLDQLGTVFILGHSSYLPTVLNRNFQAFNGIQNLKFGDLVRLQSGTVEYVYRVDRVYRANAENVTVPIAGPTQRLVLATCNSFGSTDDRYIVEADLLETKTI